MNLLKLFPGALLAATFMPGAALAQASAALPAQKAPAADVQTFEDWTVRCVASSTPPCQMIQQAQNKAGKRVSSVLIVYLPHQNSYAIQLVTPLGVAFSKGVKISAGTWNSQAMPFRRCDASGCFVQGAIESAVLDTLGRGPAQGKITIAAAADGKTVEIPFSLRGFAAARTAMENGTRAKESTAPAAKSAPAKPASLRR